MTGTRPAPTQLFCDFDLERYVPAERMLAETGRFPDINGMRTKLRPFYGGLAAHLLTLS